jgi:hypothetical protein
MNKATILVTIAVAFCMNALAEIDINTTPYYPNDSARKVLANRLKHVWRNITETEYVHSGNSVVDEMNGVYMFDCSGFICEVLLKEALDDHYDDIYAYWETHKASIVDTNGMPMNSIRPLAGHFYDYFRDDILESAEVLSASNDYWYVFQDINELQRGDLIVARYHDQWRIDYTNRTTGHLMIAWDVGALDGANNSVVRVFDSTESVHTAAEDTRAQNNPPNAIGQTGIGSGLMTFKVSTNGKNRPYQYLWSTTSANWYSLYDGESPDNYNRLEGIILARPIFTPYTVKPDPAIEDMRVIDQGDGNSVVTITIVTNLAASAYSVEYTDSLTPIWRNTDVDASGDRFDIAVSNSIPRRFFRLIRK